MESIFLQGAQGAGNFGDDLILEGALHKYPNAHVFSQYKEPSVTVDLTNRLTVFYGNASNVIERLKTAPENSVLIFAGGGLCWSGQHIDMMYTIANYCKDSGIRVRIERIGLQGMHQSLESMLKLLQISELIKVRDQMSADLAQQLGLSKEIPIQVKRCFVEYLPPLIHTPKKDLCLISLFILLQTQRNKIIDAIQDVIQSNPTITFCYIVQTNHFLPQCSEITYLQFLLEKIPNLQVIYPSTAIEQYRTFEEATAIISCGYHATLLPVYNHIPVFHIVNIDESTKQKSIAIENNLPHHFMSSDITLAAAISPFLKTYFTQNE